MSINVKKKSIKKIVSIILIILIVILVIWGIRIIKAQIEIKQTEEKLSQINAEELETKIIEKLKDSKLKMKKNVSEIEIFTVFDKCNIDIDCNFEDYISAFIGMKGDDEIVAMVVIPCFKIESDNNGNFKSIEYVYIKQKPYIVHDIIYSILKDEYNIEFDDGTEDKFIKYSSNNKKTCYYSNDGFCAMVLNTLDNGDRDIDSYTANIYDINYSTNKIGIWD